MKIGSKTKNNIIFLAAILLSISFHYFFIFSQDDETIQNVGLYNNTGINQNNETNANGFNKQKSNEYNISNLKRGQKRDKQEIINNETSDKHENKRSQTNNLIIKDNVIKISKIKNIDNATVLYIKKDKGENKYFIKKSREKLKEVNRAFIQEEYSENVIRISNNNEEIAMIKKEGFDPNITIAALVLANPFIKKIIDAIEANGIDLESMKGMEIRLIATQDGFKLERITKL